MAGGSRKFLVLTNHFPACLVELGFVIVLMKNIISMLGGLPVISVAQKSELEDEKASLIVTREAIPALLTYRQYAFELILEDIKSMRQEVGVLSTNIPRGNSISIIEVEYKFLVIVNETLKSVVLSIV